MIRVKDLPRGLPGGRLLGPNCPGLITPGVGKIGHHRPAQISSPGEVGPRLPQRHPHLRGDGGRFTKAGRGPVDGRRHRRGGPGSSGSPSPTSFALSSRTMDTTHLVLIGRRSVGSDERKAAEPAREYPAERSSPSSPGGRLRRGSGWATREAIVSGKQGDGEEQGRGLRGGGHPGCGDDRPDRRAPWLTRAATRIPFRGLCRHGPGRTRRRGA